MKVNREELAWAAGFFDGEGTIGCYVELHKPTKMYPNRPIYTFRRVDLRIGQKDRRALDRFQAAVLGLGQIYKNKTRNLFTFETNKFESVQAIVAMLYGFLSPVKQEQCLRALKAAQGKEA